MTAISAARKFAGFGAAVATLLAVAGCATQPKTPLTAEQINARVDVYRLGLGDKVRVIACRPMSKTKTWRLVEVLERAK